MVQAHIHKPLLLEEFGKIVWEKDIPKGYIEKKRNPVYEAMTGVTMDSVKQCACLLSLQLEPAVTYAIRCEKPRYNDAILACGQLNDSLLGVLI